MNATLRDRMDTRSHAGTTLLECLAYIAVFCVVVNLCVSAFVSTARLSAFQTTALDRMREVEDVREAFTRAVRSACAVAPGVGAYTSGANQLVLEMPSSDAAVKRYTVFGMFGAKSRLARLDIVSKDGELDASAYVTYALPVKALRFECDSGHARSVQCELDVPNAAKKKTKPPVTYRFLAAFRGISERAAS